LNSEVLEDRHALRIADAPSGLTNQLLGHTGNFAVLRDWDLLERADHVIGTDDVLLDPRMIDSILLNQDPSERSKQPCVRSWFHLQMDVRHLGGFRSTWIDDDHGAIGVLGHLLERDPRARNAVGLPRILADEDTDLAVLEVRSKSARVIVPIRQPPTQNSPVFSCAKALDR
jgi:hypothetical protein